MTFSICLFSGGGFKTETADLHLKLILKYARNQQIVCWRSKSFISCFSKSELFSKDSEIRYVFRIVSNIDLKGINF